MAEGWAEINRLTAQEMEEIPKRQPWWTITDMAWVVCLHRADVIDQATAARLLRALVDILNDESPGSGEDRLAPRLDGNMDLASIVNYGRTLQEPMSRLKMRASVLDLFDDLLRLLGVVIGLAEENVDTVMPGYTHLNQGQPITLCHYMLSVIDGLERGVEQQLELAYKYTNRNSGGCGSSSGTIWPVDRWHLTRILGFDDLVEPTYDSESAQDHSLSILFALTNVVILLSQVAMDMNIWQMEEMDMVRANPKWAGVSSFMPQKCDTGSNFERTRVKACDVIGEMMKCVVQLKGEPHADMQPQFQLPYRVHLGMTHARECFGWITNMLDNVFPQKERMLQLVREGFSCSTELAAYLIREKGYGGRLAHSIVATMVRQARVKQLKAYEVTGDMLDQAADYLGVEAPGVDTETVRQTLDPEHFVRTHVHTGGTAPEEARRLLAIRKENLAGAQKRQEGRIARVEAGEELLHSEIKKIGGTGIDDLLGRIRLLPRRS
jgi:argininosuccinate lyase